MVTQFFGERWDAPRVDDAVQVNTPVGELCMHCDEPIKPDNRGLLMGAIDLVDGETVYSIRPAHLECDLRGIFSHIYQPCHCFVPNRSLREEARATLTAINEQRAAQGFGPM